MQEKLMVPPSGQATAGPARIPFNRPGLVGTEFAYIQAAIDAMHVSGDGAFSKSCQQILEDVVGARALLTTSCTDALEMAALLLDIQPGDEVIVPSFTFTSTAGGFVLRGARPVFADVRPDTLNLDERQLERLISPRTRAVVPVHYAGVGCEMDAITAIADSAGLAVVEDNAHGLFASYRGRPLGSFGALATLSFHETKNVVCGEGGALLINDRRYVARAEILREKGTNRNQFFRGQVDKYSWVDIGSSFLPSDILAAFLYAQLEAWPEIQRKRRRVWEFYADALAEWAAMRDVSLPFVPPDCQQSYHMFYLLMPTAAVRDAFIAYMKAAGITCIFHYVPLHLSVMGQRFGARPDDCPVSVDVSERLVRLPFYNDLSAEQLEFVVDTARQFPA